VIIETTGIADPAPILQTIIGEQVVSQSYVLSSVLTAVDAVNGLGSLDAHFEAVKQVAVADRILLTKTDLIDASPDALLAKLNTLAPSAPTSTIVGGEASADWFFNVGQYEVAGKGVDVPTWLEGERLAVAEQAPHDHSGHVHDRNRHQRIESSCLIFEEPVDPGLFEACLEMLMQFRGADLLRVKGIINVSGMDRPMVIHGVQHVFHPPEVLERWPSGDRRTKLVVIARDLDHGELKATFSALGLEAI
jgi:G3E family GTPase